MPSLLDYLPQQPAGRMGELNPYADEAQLARDRAAASLARGQRPTSFTQAGRQETANPDPWAGVNFFMPHSPAEAALTAFPYLRWGSKAAVAAIAAMMQPTEAEAGPVGKLLGAAKKVGRAAPRAELTAAEKAAPYPEAKFPQYADEYPPVGPPGVNPETGDPMRVLTPEAEAFRKERNRIQADMKKHGYTPYFNPAERYPVNPADYPTPKNTLEVRPAKEDTVRKWLDQIGAPEARARLDAAVAKGEGLGDTSRWYQMGQAEAEAKRMLGEQQGREAFANTFAAPMAATTAGQPPGPNLMLSGYVNYMRNKGLPLPESFVDTPFPIQRGQFGIGPSMANYTKMMDAGGLSSLGLENPKRHDFAYDFVGHRFPVIDEQMSKGMAPNVSVKGRYGLFRQVAEEQAAAAGKSPEYYQEVGWHGFGNKQGKPMISEMNDMIERTHRLTGRPREEIYKLYLEKKIPVYGVGGAVAATSLLDLMRTDNPSN